MTKARFICIVMFNFCLNFGVIWLLYRWQVSRKRAPYHALCRESRVICQQVRQLEKELARKEEVLS
jgi:hypothetical protein